MEIKRDNYLKQLIKKKDNGRVKIITGIRRCGKSYLLFTLFKNYLINSGISKDQIIELALDEVGNSKYRDPFELNDYIKSRILKTDTRYYVFIDEIQFCDSVPNPYVKDSKHKITFIDTVLGLVKLKNIDIYITGSNSLMLSKDILTQFRDRGDEIHLAPLSFSEVLPVYQEQNKSKTEALRDYFTFGGMPYVLSLDTSKEKIQYLTDLVDETYIKDIIEKNNLRNDKEILDTLLNFISSAIGSLTNPSKLARRFFSEHKIDISHTTICRYLNFFEQSYILESSRRYDVKGSMYYNTPLKYYFTDMGLRNARLNFRQVEDTHLMENIIYNELRCRNYKVDVGVINSSCNVLDTKHNISKKTKTQLEVDFVVNLGHQRYYIQSAFNIADTNKLEQETASLNKIDDSFKKIIIVKDDIVPHHDSKGILYLGLDEFLLNLNSLDQ